MACSLNWSCLPEHGPRFEEEETGDAHAPVLDEHGHGDVAVPVLAHAVDLGEEHGEDEPEQADGGVQTHQVELLSLRSDLNHI